MMCVRCGSSTEPCECECKRTFVRARVYDYLDRVTVDLSSTPPVSAAGERGPSAAAGSPLLASHEKPAVRALDTWHDLYLIWRQEHPDVRGITWRCEHGPHDPTAERGPVRRTAAARGRFSLGTTWQIRNDHAWFANKQDQQGMVRWDGAA